MFAIEITQKAEKEYYDLKSLVQDGSKIDELVARCHGFTDSQPELASALIYCAVIEANCGPTDLVRIGRARALLALAESHPFAHFLGRYLEEKQQFAPTAVAFASTVPYDVWAATSFYRGYRLNTLSSISTFIHKTPPPADNGVPVICDIGPGNGLLLGDIVASALSIHRLARLKVVVVEMSQNMLQDTINHLKARFGSQIECVPLADKIQDIKPNALAEAAGNKEFWFTLGSASLHHMPADIKGAVLRKLAISSPYLLVSDFAANHDLPEHNSPQLVYSVSNFYAYFLDDVWRTTSESPARRWQAISDFFLTEAINMLTNPRATRIDYHAPVAQWVQLAREAGYEAHGTEVTSYDDQRPITFTTTYHRV